MDYDLEHIFSYHSPTSLQQEKYQALRNEAKRFAESIHMWVPEGADRSAAIRHVRDAVMTANAGIALGGRLTVEAGPTFVPSANPRPATPDEEAEIERMEETERRIRDEVSPASWWQPNVYMKRPTAHQAIRWDANTLDVLAFAGPAAFVTTPPSRPRIITVETLHGKVSLHYGDWIVKNPDGYLYVRQHDHFLRDFVAWPGVTSAPTGMVANG